MFKKVMNILKGIFYFSMMTLSLIIGIVGTSVIGPACLIGLTPTLFLSARTLPQFGQPIKNSIFQIHPNHKIFQNCAAKPIRTLKCIKSEDKINKITEEGVNLLVELDEKDIMGNKITYNTVSQSLTKYSLRTLERNGYIENLTSEKKKCKNLFIEKIMFGNTNTILKKETMYKLSFNLTDKERNKEELLELLNKSNKILEKKI